MDKLKLSKIKMKNRAYHRFLKTKDQQDSSNVNEVVRAVLNSLIFFFFYENFLHAPKAPKVPKALKAQKRNQAKAQKRDSEFSSYKMELKHSVTI